MTNVKARLLASGFALIAGAIRFVGRPEEPALRSGVLWLFCSAGAAAVVCLPAVIALVRGRAVAFGARPFLGWVSWGADSLRAGPGSGSGGGRISAPA